MTPGLLETRATNHTEVPTSTSMLTYMHVHVYVHAPTHNPTHMPHKHIQLETWGEST